MNCAVVFDEAKFPELVHEKINSGPRRADHLRQHLLRYFGEDLHGQARRTIAGKQQQSPRQPLLARVEELVDQIPFDSDVSRQHVRDEPVGELMFRVEDAQHFLFLNDKHGSGSDCDCGRHALGEARKTLFPEKVSRSKQRDNRLSASIIDYRQLHAAFLDVHYGQRGIALCENRFVRPEFMNFSSQTDRIEKRPHIKRSDFRIRF